MPNPEKPAQSKASRANRARSLLRNGVKFSLAAALAAVVLLAGMLIYNNVSFSSDKTFTRNLDAAIEKALLWTEMNKAEILTRRNIALIKMLQESNRVKPTPLLSELVAYFLATPSRPRCWNRLLDANAPIDSAELNLTIQKSPLDNKWVLYAMAPDKADVNAVQLGLFEPDRWHGRKLTHQLDALLFLAKSPGHDSRIDGLIEHLCGRLSRQLVTDFAVVDIYIQKVTFVLRAPLPQKIRRRWVERIIGNQLPDGGWNDRWLWVTSDRRRPVVDFKTPPSNQHATLQALTALYLVRYKYPQHFGVEQR